MKHLGIACFLLVLAGLALPAAGEFRFPMPEFDTGYTHPVHEMPAPAAYRPWLDSAALVGALSLGAWLVLVRRSRKGVFALTIACLLYFGFWRKGCVCPVGSIQNVTEAVLDPSAGISWLVLFFFLAPLVFALFFGRIFCAAVCPLGAMQELAAIRPVQIAKPVEAALRLLPYVYLGLMVLAIATGSGYIVCRYDPFVGFWRQGATLNMFLVGGIFLGAGIFIARPYCRFLCPYGVLLGWVSRFSKWHAKITPTKCIQCRLCEESCPYGAIDVPAPDAPPMDRREGVRRLGRLLIAAPAIIAFAAWAGYMSHSFLSNLHPTVRLAERVAQEEQGLFQEMSIESEVFRAGGRSPVELYAEAQSVRHAYAWGAAWLGVFLGLVVVLKLVVLSRAHSRRDYEPDRAACVSCARCFAYCPVEEEDGTLPQQENGI